VKFFVVVRPEHIQHVLVKHPDKYVKGISHEKLRVAIGNGILTLEGEKWYRQRKLMQPVYTPKGIRPYAEIMTDEAQHLIERWGTQLPPDRVVDINQEMTRVTVNVIIAPDIYVRDRAVLQGGVCVDRGATAERPQGDQYHRAADRRPMTRTTSRNQKMRPAGLCQTSG
jgi:cytochrome P450